MNSWINAITKLLQVDELISAVKNIFLKARISIKIFKNMFPDLSLSLQSIVTIRRT